MSIHNIPNGQNDLRVAMTNLAQSYYNIGALNISNIPMKVYTCCKKKALAYFLLVI
jgi:hypothetical protein